jgi:hypothetical protein
MPSLQSIAAARDRKVQACLRGGVRTHFWYAGAAEEGAGDIAQLHRMGFDNYPLAPIDDPHGFLFFEELFGCDIVVQDRAAPSPFTTWPLPKFASPDEMPASAPALDGHPIWHAYFGAVREYLDSVDGAERLPLPARGFSPLDLACNLCGTANLFLWMKEAADGVHRLFDVAADLYLAVRGRLRDAGVSMVNYLGFPCVSCSDLQMPAISPDAIRRFVLPCYAKVARACGGAFIGLDCDDASLFGEVMRLDWLLGCSFDRRLPLPLIRREIGQKVFVLPHHAYDEGLDRPTLKDGLYWNPIVQCHSRDAEAVFRELAESCSMAITIVRPRLAEVVEVRNRMRGGTRAS